MKRKVKVNTAQYYDYWFLFILFYLNSFFFFSFNLQKFHFDLVFILSETKTLVNFKYLLT